MPMVIDREALTHITEDINEEVGQLTGGLLHGSIAKPWVAKNGLQVDVVDWEEVLLGGVLHVGEAHVGCEPGGDLVSSNGGGGVHGSYDDDSLEADEVEVCVVEALVAHDLLEERDQLDCLILVWLWQVDVLDVDDQSLALLWTVDTTLRVGGLRAHLIELLNHSEGGGLGITVDHCKLGGPHLLDQGGDNEVLSATLWSTEDKALVSIQEWLQD